LQNSANDAGGGSYSGGDGGGGKGHGSILQNEVVVFGDRRFAIRFGMVGVVDAQ
jgi:hypothetical protein